MIAAIDRKELDINAERAQALRLAVVHDRVAGVVDTGDAVIENIAEIAVEPVRELAPEGVGIGHSHSVPRGYRVKRHSVDADALVGLRANEPCPGHPRRGHRVDERTRHDEARAGRDARDCRQRGEVQMVVVLVRTDHDVDVDRFLWIEGRRRDPLGHRREKWIEEEDKSAGTNREAGLSQPPERDRPRRKVEPA